MAMKFFQIAQADAEIERLTAEGETLRVSMVAAKANDENHVSLIRDAASKIASLEADLAAAQLSVGTLTASLATEKAAKETAEGKIAGVEADVEKRASAKAAAIVAAQGVPPVATKGNPNPAGTKSDFSELFGIAKVEAAFKAQNQKNY